jgi:carbamoyltransferase
MLTLGINAAYHDPAACLVDSGIVVAAAEEERFTHVKHGKRPIPFTTWELPFHAIDFCLQEAGVQLKDVDHVAYSYDPHLLPQNLGEGDSVHLPLKPRTKVSENWESPWDPLFLSAIVNSPQQLADGAPHHLQDRFRDIGPDPPYRWHFVPHHLAHASSAFHPSPFQRAAVLTLDGRGESATTGYALGEGKSLEWLGQVNVPHSLGILYEEITSYLGFLRSSDEYKVMALASFGKPRFIKAFREIIRMEGRGKYAIGPLRLEERFGPPRRRNDPFQPRHYDIAHSLQVALEETVLELAHWLAGETGCSKLCLAGGVALNCVLNARIRDRSPFRDVWVQPAAGDAGTALGAALYTDIRERGGTERCYEMTHAFLGPSYDDEAIASFLTWSKLPHRRMNNVPEEVAEILAQDKVIGWFQGRMEFGPRALGARSILASPIHAEMQARLNDIKDREDFRPVAPVVLEEEAHHWFENARQSPFMLFVFDVRPEQADRIPAVRHVDGTARIQTINHQQNPLLHDLLRAFAARTGVPVLVNTSFNTRGEPIVCSPRDAIESFLTSPLDALAIGSLLITKPEVSR